MHAAAGTQRRGILLWYHEQVQVTLEVVQAVHHVDCRVQIRLWIWPDLSTSRPPCLRHSGMHQAWKCSHGPECWRWTDIHRPNVLSRLRCAAVEFGDWFCGCVQAKLRCWMSFPRRQRPQMSLSDSSKLSQAFQTGPSMNDLLYTHSRYLIQHIAGALLLHCALSSLLDFLLRFVWGSNARRAFALSCHCATLLASTTELPPISTAYTANIRSLSPDLSV